MSDIDLQSIIDIHGVDKNEIAPLLFPNIKFPNLALNRILAREAKLDSEQIAKLALFLDVSANDLYAERWKSIKINKNVASFSYKDFEAKLDLSTMFTRVFHKKTLYSETTLHSRSISLAEFFKYLDSLIINFKSE